MSFQEHPLQTIQTEILETRVFLFLVSLLYTNTYSLPSSLIHGESTLNGPLNCIHVYRGGHR